LCNIDAGFILLPYHLFDIGISCVLEQPGIGQEYIPNTAVLDDVARTVACSIVTSRIDYCNSLYAGMSASNFKKLQRVQNTLA